MAASVTLESREGTTRLVCGFPSLIKGWPATFHQRSGVSIGQTGVQNFGRTAHLLSDPGVDRIAAWRFISAFGSHLLAYFRGVDGLKCGGGHLLEQLTQMGAARGAANE